MRVSGEAARSTRPEGASAAARSARRAGAPARAVARAALLALRRDRAALALTFLVPVVFFSIFAAIFGGASARAATRRVRLLAVDEDGSPRSRRLLDALAAEPALDLRRAPARANGEAGAPAPYDRAAAEAAVRAGEAPLALVVPGGFGAARLAFGRAPAGAPRPRVELLADRSDPIAPQLVAGLLQKVVFTRLPELTIAGGVDALDPVAQFTPEQRARMAELAAAAGAASERAAPGGGAGDAPIEIATRDLLGETKKNPMVAFYAAGLGVMFLMFTAAGAGGALIEERESGTLERILSTEVTMTSLLAGKLLHLTALGVVQLALMFAWGAAVFGLDLRGRIAGSLLLALPTALASSSFGLVLAALAKSRKQLVALSNLLVLSLAAIGGSMFPRFLMPESVQRLGLVAWNAWALEGFLDVLWRDAPLAALVPEISVLLLWSALFFLLARRLSRSWEVV